MQYTRRDALKVGLFGSAALALPLQRAASGESVLDDRMPSSKLPKPFTLPFRLPPVAVPVATHGDEDCYRIRDQGRRGSRSCPASRPLCGRTTASVPGPTIIDRGRAARRRCGSSTSCR